jgi:hypothetical protein
MNPVTSPPGLHARRDRMGIGQRSRWLSSRSFDAMDAHHLTVPIGAVNPQPPTRRQGHIATHSWRESAKHGSSQTASASLPARRLQSAEEVRYFGVNHPCRLALHDAVPAVYTGRTRVRRVSEEELQILVAD